jgi:hypothetical protein
VQRSARAGPELRLAPVELRRIDLVDFVIPVRVRALDDSSEARALLLVPREEQRAADVERDAGFRRVRG